MNPLLDALQKIADLKPQPFEFPPDLREQIAACEECQGWAKDHPVQRGICDKHRQPLWDRERHETFESHAIGPRAQRIACDAIAAANRIVMSL